MWQTPGVSSMLYVSVLHWCSSAVLIYRAVFVCCLLVGGVGKTFWKYVYMCWHSYHKMHVQSAYYANVLFLHHVQAFTFFFYFWYGITDIYTFLTFRALCWLCADFYSRLLECVLWMQCKMPGLSDLYNFPDIWDISVGKLHCSCMDF
jgi:hypothetical protein